MPNISNLTLSQLNELEKLIPVARSMLVAHVIREALKPLGLDVGDGEILVQTLDLGDGFSEYSVSF